MPFLFFLILFSIIRVSIGVENSRRLKREEDEYDPYDHPIFSLTEEDLHSRPQEDLDYIEQFFLDNPDLKAPPHIIQFFHPIFALTEKDLPTLSDADLDYISQFLIDNPELEAQPWLDTAIEEWENSDYINNEYDPFDKWENIEGVLQFYLDNPDLEPIPEIIPYFHPIFSISEEAIPSLDEGYADYISQFFEDNQDLVPQPWLKNIISSTTNPTTTKIITTTSTTTKPITKTTITTTSLVVLDDIQREDVQMIMDNTPPWLAPTTTTTTAPPSITNFAMSNTPPWLSPASTTTIELSTPAFIMDNTPPALAASTTTTTLSKPSGSSTPSQTSEIIENPEESMQSMGGNPDVSNASPTPASVSDISQCKLTQLLFIHCMSKIISTETVSFLVRVSLNISS